MLKTLLKQLLGFLLLDFSLSSGLYYKRVTVVIDAPSVISKWRYNLERHLRS